MATVELSTVVRARGAEKPDLLTRAGALFARLFRQAEERRTIVKLARMSPRQLEDMGFDPAAIYRAVEGTWAEVDPGRFHHP
jgi:uncharacterized protein YjiS (DUF1127 family)